MYSIDSLFGILQANATTENGSCWYPRFRNFNSVVPVDVIGVKSYVDSFIDPTGVPVWVSINKLYLVAKRVLAGLIGTLRNGGGLGTGESYIPVMLLILSCQEPIRGSVNLVSTGVTAR